MCGIYCSIFKFRSGDDRFCDVQVQNVNKIKPCVLQGSPTAEIKNSLMRRGPDLTEEVKLQLTEEWCSRIVGSVLWTQGLQPTKQPLQDEQGNFLLWNGDVLYGTLAQDDRKLCDSEIIFTHCKESPLDMACRVAGPHAWVFWDSSSRRLWFGRDVLGRQSLLWSVSSHHITLTSVAHKSLKTAEVPALGVYMVDFSSAKEVVIQFFPWAHLNTSLSSLSDVCVVERERLIHAIMGDGSARLTWLGKEPSETDLAGHPRISLEEYLRDPVISGRVDSLLNVLTEAVKCRVTRHPQVCKGCTQSYMDQAQVCSHCVVGVLFSGGLDSTVLALLADKFVPPEVPIDLYNVAFQLQDGSFQVPDRITGLSSLQELRLLAPGRTWNFVEINIDREELATCRSEWISHLVHPLGTVLDDSLGCALWFTARGQGCVDRRPYTSPARIVLLGMGADEQLGGYTRHRNTLRRSGRWAALGVELAADTDQIARRNLGRDNRVVSDHGRQPRTPFLDERVVTFIDTLPPWHRCMPTAALPAGVGDKLLLRLSARRLGLRGAATLPKRALQFGSRIANRKEKADQPSDRL